MVEPTPLERDLLVANPLDDGSGFTWTLASRLGDMLHEAETLFGPRDCSYTVLGIEFCDGNPRIWYPGNRRHVVIQLSVSCMQEPAKALYQLAQECIHLLSPSGGMHANVLEEGLSVHFAERYVAEKLRVMMHCRVARNYAAARDLVASLLAVDPMLVRRLRETQPALHLLTTDDLIECDSRVSRSLAEQLTAPFVY